MKTTFKYHIRSQSGTLDDLTMCSYNKGMVCVSRKHVIPAQTSQNEEFKADITNVGVLYRNTSASYKQDLKSYAQKLGGTKAYRARIRPSGYAIFNKMVFAVQQADPENNDLKYLTVNDIMTKNLPCKTVAAAVEAGIIDHVPGYVSLNHTISV